MKVRLAEDAGFCFGVSKALKKIKDSDGNSCILGKLIHNNEVINGLKQKGFRFVESIDRIDKGPVIISAHGVSDKAIIEIKEKGLEIVDTTCPLVKNVHKITKDLEKQGYRIIIFGDKQHTEVKGIIGNLNHPIIISGISEIDEIPPGRYALVSQTTQDIAMFNEISNRLKEQIPDVVIKETICSATKSRQEKSKRLAEDVDFMIVIGSHHSANTKRLAEICSKIVETKHIETEKDIKKEWFKDKRYVGVTAGASTPDYIIKKVMEDIEGY